MHTAAKVGFRPLWQNLTCNLEVFGSFPSLSLTGGIRIPLRTANGNFVGLWLGLLLLLVAAAIMRVLLG